MHHKDTLLTKLKRYLISGLLLWLPLIATFYIIKFLFDLLNNAMNLVHITFPSSTGLSNEIPGIGFIISIVVLLISGALASNLLGKKIVHIGENILARIPLIRSIYKAIKQITHAVLNTSNQSFRQVVLIEYPKKGCFSLAFQTASSLKIDQSHANMTTVFLPTTPNPTSGFLLILPSESVSKVEVPVEEALKFIVSLGTAIPEKFSRTEINNEPSSN